MATLEAALAKQKKETSQKEAAASRELGALRLEKEDMQAAAAEATSQRAASEAARSEAFKVERQSASRQLQSLQEAFEALGSARQQEAEAAEIALRRASCEAAAQSQNLTESVAGLRVQLEHEIEKGVQLAHISMFGTQYVRMWVCLFISYLFASCRPNFVLLLTVNCYHCELT